LQRFAEENSLANKETSILACGQLIRACGEDELPLILYQLVEYLGHPNAIISGVAYNELDSLQHLLGTKLEDLLRPYWGTIGVSVVKDIQKRPQKIQRLADLLDRNVTSFLLLTQTETLPHLVLTKQRDVIQRIAQSRKETTTIEDVCLQPRKNLAGILAMLFSQPVDKPERLAIDTLKAISPAFPRTEDQLSEWIKLEQVLTACEMLKTAAEDESKRQKVNIQSIHLDTG
jgi:serine/threonine-protein kinase ATR